MSASTFDARRVVDPHKYQQECTDFTTQRRVRICRNTLLHAWVDSATELRDLMIPPANRLEALKRDREGQYSVRTSAESWLAMQEAVDLWDGKRHSEAV